MSGVIDVGVVGAGPAGLAAALAAGDLGCEVTLIDAGLGPGGQRYHQNLLFPGPGQAQRGAAGHLPPELARIRQAQPGQQLGRQLAATTVTRAERGRDGVVTLWVGGPEGGAETTVEVRALVLATGSAELVLPFPGWDLPGVTTAGAARALLQSQGVTVGQRVLVAGSGPRLFPLAADLAGAGVDVVAVLEATPGPGPGPAELAAAGYVAGPDRPQVPVRTGHAVVACQGHGRVERAVIARLDRDWRPIPGAQSVESVDAVHVSFGFSPALELPATLGCATSPHPAAVTCDADLATSVPGVFAAGELTGVSGAEAAQCQGYLAGASAARYLGRPDATGYAARIRPRLAEAARRAARLDQAYPLRPGWLDWPEPDTVLCRCQGTRWSEVGAEATRGGPGGCRGRVCGPVLAYAASAASRGRQ